MMLQPVGLTRGDDAIFPNLLEIPTDYGHANSARPQRPASHSSEMEVWPISETAALSAIEIAIAPTVFGRN